MNAGELKRELERVIATLVQEKVRAFEIETGLAVTYVEIERLDVSTMGRGPNTEYLTGAAKVRIA